MRPTDVRPVAARHRSPEPGRRATTPSRERAINLRAYRRDDRDRTGGNRANDRFLIKRLQIFGRSSAPADDDCIVTPGTDLSQSRKLLLGRLRPLHRGGDEVQRNPGVSAGSHGFNVAVGGAGLRSNHRDPSRDQRLHLLRSVKEAFGFQLPVQGF